MAPVNAGKKIAKAIWEDLLHRTGTGPMMEEIEKVGNKKNLLLTWEHMINQILLLR